MNRPICGASKRPTTPTAINTATSFCGPSPAGSPKACARSTIRRDTGGEELAAIRPAHRLDGAYAIAERVRAAIEAVRVPRFRSTGMLSITASVGVAASSDGHKVAPIAEADAGLYRAERQVKNCTVGASTEAAKVFSAE